MKKMVIVTRRMIMGGIEKSLISLVEALPKEEFEITILVMGYGGELEGEIPKHVKVKCLYGDEKSTIEKIRKSLLKFDINTALKIGYYTLLAKKSKSIFQQEMYHTKMVPAMDEEYDFAIAYHVPASLPVVYVINKLKAKQKFAWIHSDVSQYERSLMRYKEFYDKYDKVYCVSGYAKQKFIEMFPNLKDKTFVFYNIVEKQKLIDLASTGDSYNDNFNGHRILTVGRLTSQKGYDIIPIILKKLIDEGTNLRWYWIGDGEKRVHLEKLILENGLENQLILLGTKSNPYPFIKDCDIYLQPSRHEGYCITLAEARAFNKPIITTDFVGAREQIINGETGIIVKFNEIDIYNQIMYLLRNQNKLKEFEEKLAKCSKLNDSDINEITTV